jgi:hypothetical protein
VLVAADFDLYLAPLLEWRIGRGTLIFCQLDVTSRIGIDPAATRLVTNLLEYLDGPVPPEPPGGVASLGGPDAAALAEILAVVADPASPVRLIGPDWHGDAQSVAAGVKEGGRAVVVGNADASVLEPFMGASVASQPVHRVRVPLELRQGGICPSDLFWREVRSVPVLRDLPDDAIATDPPVLAVRRLGEGEVAWIGVSPLTFDDPRGRAKALRLITALLRVRGPVPDLTASKAIVGGPSSVYASRQLDFNPYRYRRW